ncbi:SPW repeat protein [Oleiagrimonas sp. C23AA]|uniref:SPW repeat protein n=1 Tax=Oleiagrimonas sp. C23AA TaxID=2719047 RepID=UPI001422CC34|nr:SPW repeat protein [Oleiagrimonas sp. C23AA]NII11079.1 SPW repeat protein [Oleiagrimonas sp. C23AA]
MEKRWQDGVNFVLGLWLVATPWIFQQLINALPADIAGVTAWNMWVVGIALIITCSMSLSAYFATLQWLNILFGAWLVASPWVLGFSALTEFAWNAVIAGGLVVLFAGWALIQAGSAERHGELKPQRPRPGSTTQAR